MGMAEEKEENCLEYLCTLFFVHYKMSTFSICTFQNPGLGGRTHRMYLTTEFQAIIHNEQNNPNSETCLLMKIKIRQANSSARAKEILMEIISIFYTTL